MARALRRLAVIGDPVAHSLSPAMHNPALRALGLQATYEAIRVEAAKLPAFLDMARRELDGFNVTVPHKQAVIPLLDSVSDECRLSGSVNTVTVGPDGRCHGESTDGHGLEMALLEAFGTPLAGAEVLLVGCGGAARAVAFHLLSRGVGRLAIANRTLATALEFAAALRQSRPEAQVEVFALDDHKGIGAFIARGPFVVQSTSVGLKPGDPSPLPPELLVPGAKVFDMIYRRGALLQAAAARGCPWADGRGMLLHQGVRSLEIWTGLKAPVEIMRAALDQALDGR